MGGVEEHIAGVIFALVDSVIFIFAITLVVFLSGNATTASTAVNQRIVKNETTVAQSGVSYYDGYDSGTMYAGFQSGNTVAFDGVLTGQQVYTDIVSGSDKQVVIERGGSSKALHSTYVDGVSVLRYVRETDPNKLKDYMNLNREYVRKYQIDNSTGKSTGVIYREK